MHFETIFHNGKARVQTESVTLRRAIYATSGRKFSIAKYGNLTPSGPNFCELGVQREEDRWPLPRLVGLSSSVSRVSR